MPASIKGKGMLSQQWLSIPFPLVDAGTCWRSPRPQDRCAADGTAQGIPALLFPGAKSLQA